ncbi:hypothetical protein [Horticoccus sp. 23ND18S-11]|uniref:hypothetical protein n=1 Tax=Horticoccus sp. 23ND18S-11 TaxID=3391832 RepID=UPI0039C9E447
MKFLATWVRGIEHRGIEDRQARETAENALAAAQVTVTRLSVTNAEQAKDIESLKADRRLRGAIIGICAACFGVTAQIAIEKPSFLAVFSTCMFGVIAGAGYFLPSRNLKN